MQHAKAQPIRVLLVSDYPLTLWGLQRFVESMAPPAQLVGTAADAVEARAILGRQAADIVLIDLDGDSGIETIAELGTASPARVLALTGSRDLSLHDGAVLAGARGVVLKAEPVESLASAIARVHQGEFWIGGTATRRIVLHLSRKRLPLYSAPDHRKIATLTRRERETIAEVIRDARAGCPTLAQRLDISENLLRQHLATICGKLGVSSRLELFTYARLHRIGGTI